MLTKNVEFNGVRYNIRNNMRTKMLFEKELDKNGSPFSETEGIVRYAWCLLRGYNLNFDMSFDEFSMHLDDDINTDFILASVEVVSDGNKNAENEETVSDEKK